MKEILGGNLEKAFEELYIDAQMTYMGRTILDDNTQIWEVEDKDFERLCELEEEDWKTDWGWWRSAEGSNMFNELDDYIINGQSIIAWDGTNRVESEEEEDEEDRWWFEREYNSLFEYFCEEIGASQPRNVCALAVDLARINNIKMSELFQRYQG